MNPVARAVSLVLFVVIGFACLSRSCSFSRPGGPIALMNGRVVSITGYDQSARFVAIAGGKIAAISFMASSDHASTPSGAREIGVSGLYIAAATFDKSSLNVIDGLRHVWVGQMGVGDPGDVVIMRDNPARMRPGYIPDANSIVGAVVDGVYYSSRDLSRSPRTR